MVGIELRVPCDPQMELGTGRDPCLELESDYVGSMLPEYRGATYIIPSESEQILRTEGTRLSTEITVAPIPSNYGRITWDGSTITVS